MVVLLLGLDHPAGFDGWGRLISIATVGGAIQIASFAYALPRLSASGYSIISALQSFGIAVVVVGIIVERLLRQE
jgi:drug/metabolite transporter (DMT)-like permease